MAGYFKLLNSLIVKSANCTNPELEVPVAEVLIAIGEDLEPGLAAAELRGTPIGGPKKTTNDESLQIQ